MERQNRNPVVVRLNQIAPTGTGRNVYIFSTASGSRRGVNIFASQLPDIARRRLLATWRPFFARVRAPPVIRPLSLRASKYPLGLHRAGCIASFGPDLMSIQLLHLEDSPTDAELIGLLIQRE